MDVMFERNLFACMRAIGKLGSDEVRGRLAARLCTLVDAYSADGLESRRDAHLNVLRAITKDAGKVGNLVEATCADDFQIGPRLDSFPLLARIDGEIIRTEDGKLSMMGLVYAMMDRPGSSWLRTAVAMGTTEQHARQLAAYAILAGHISI